MNPFWITFYSYKGGVGRSLALANTAALLVQRGRRVVLIDFDLEAPGLDSFDEFKCIAGKPGVVEYVSNFTDTNRAPDIDPFVHSCDLPGPLRGKLWIMPAGKKDPLYNSRRAGLSWADLYENHHGEQFVENWKAAIARHCQPDYVFVDSRTGLTEVGGICTLHLPDLVVMLFGLNEQNVRGVAEVAKAIRESELTRLPQLHYVVSPVPNLPREKQSPLLRRWNDATERIGTKISSSIRYQHIAALSERLFVLDSDLEASPLVLDYTELLDSLIDYNRNGLDFLLKQTENAISEGDKSLKLRLCSALEEGFPGRADALMARAQLQNALGDSGGAADLALQALNADMTLRDAFDWLLDHHRKQRDFQSALSLCNLVLTHADLLPGAQIENLHSERGQIAMAAGDYVIAVESGGKHFNYLRAKKNKRELDPETFAIAMFNDCEANRRLRQEPLPELWTSVIDLFKITGDASAAPLYIQANRWQAMHIPFALTGDILRAREALAKARKAAELLGRIDDIFTVKTYSDVPVEQFLEINDEMLAALDRGQLWDGMPLPSPSDLATIPKQESPDVTKPTATDHPGRRRPTRRFDFDD